MKKCLLLVLLASVFFAPFCVQAPDYPKEPVIELIGLSKNILRQGDGIEDTLAVTFTFTDGDGDLGFPESDSTPSVFIRDSRDSFELEPRQLPYVEPQGAGNGISGEITVFLPTSCCIYIDEEGNVSSCGDVPQTVKYDTLSYLVKIRDRAGNFSNEISTGPIVLVCHQ
ncbi:MAG: hypothetical protein SFV22_16140 [Saprospiraceae bacterium]|nr:hypothetical protein [Saprospiraceae bacterium]